MTRRTATVAIRVNGETWEVPRGFGAAYRDTATSHAIFAKTDGGHVVGVLRDLLGLVGFDASAETIAGWDDRKRVEAEVYAGLEHLSASDNPVRRHPRPSWLPLPWRGPNGEATPVA